MWPGEPFHDERTLLVAGCGTVQAAHYAVRWPRSRVIGIDVSAKSLAFAESLKRRHGLDNLELHQLDLERVAELDIRFDHIACTGVLHHLADPDGALRALRDVLTAHGSINIMVYAPYGRAGIYMLQEYCRRLGVGWSTEDVRELASTLAALPQDHPLAALIRKSPDFQSEAGLADALLHPNDRPYSVPEVFDFLARNGLAFGRWLRQAPYLPSCGAFASTPHARKLAALSAQEQYAAMELIRGTMVRHSLIAFSRDVRYVDFTNSAWTSYVPARLPDAITVREQLPPGAGAVLINRNHTYTDLWLPIDGRRVRLLNAIDGKSTIEQIAGRGELDLAHAFFRQLWEWDQVVFDSFGGKRPI